MLIIVATPIGNLKDITLRSLGALQECQAIICEDTRRTSILLKEYAIQKPLIVLNDFNESKSFPDIIQRLQLGENMCLVSDAGTPLISDPGFKLVRECLKMGIAVDSLPGASSTISALTLSALPPNQFMFLGYFPDKPSHRLESYRKIQKIAEITPTTFIFFIAPFKLQKTFTEMLETLGDIEIVLAKELTKIHQRVESKKISQWLEYFEKSSPKGEYVGLVFLSS